jgi:hypothetical protein
MELRQEPLPGDDSITAALYGPLVLAADLGAGPPDGPMRIVHGRDTEPKDLPSPAPLPKLGGIEAVGELSFSVIGASSKYRVMPVCQITDQRYSVYWQSAG